MSVDRKAYMRAYREANREKQKAYMSGWLAKQDTEARKAKDRARQNAANARRRAEAAVCEDAREFRKLTWARTQYGLTLDQYHAILERQDFGCGICGADIVSVDRRKIHIDHDHKTGKVRGILCASCNTGIGKLRDGELFAPAERYLRRAS